MEIVKLTYGCSNRRLRLLIFFIVAIGAGVFTSANSAHACIELDSNGAQITGPQSIYGSHDLASSMHRNQDDIRNFMGKSYGKHTLI